MITESLYAYGYSFRVAHGVKVGRHPVPRQAAETCRQCLQQTSAHGDEVDRCRVICENISNPPMLRRPHLPNPKG